MDLFTPEEWTAIALSLRVALVAALVGLPIGIAVALLLARKNFPGKLLLDSIVYLPLVLPPVVTGYLLLLGFGRQGPIGKFFEEWFGLVFAFRWTGAALAAGIMGFPLLVRAARLAFEAVDPRLEQASHALGRGPVSTFFRITLPLALPGVMAGTVLAFARALGEFGATITFVANIPGETQTIPTAIYTYAQTPGGEGAVLRLAAVSVIFSLCALAASEYMVRRMRIARGLA